MGTIYESNPLELATPINESPLEQSLLEGKEPVPRHKPFTWQRGVLTLLCVLFLVANSVGQSQYARISYGRLSFTSYYFLCWFTNIWLSLLFPLYLLFAFVRYLCSGPETKKTGFVGHVRQMLMANPHFSWKKYLLLGLALTFFNFFSSYIWYISLNLLPVSINTSLYKSSLIFVFILSAIFLRERIVVLKIIALVLCIAGLCMVGVGHYFESHTETIGAASGYILVIASALLWAGYEVLFRARIGSANPAGVLLIVTLLGLYSLVLLWPPLLFLPVIHAEPAVIFTPQVIQFLAVNAVLAVTYYLCYAFGIALSSAVYMSVSGMLSIPVAGLVDGLLIGVYLSPLSISGMALVFVGVLLVNAQTWGARVIGERCAPLAYECCKRPGTLDNA